MVKIGFWRLWRFFLAMVVSVRVFLVVFTPLWGTDRVLGYWVGKQCGGPHQPQTGSCRYTKGPFPVTPKTPKNGPGPGSHLALPAALAALLAFSLTILAAFKAPLAALMPLLDVALAPDGGLSALEDTLAAKQSV